MTHEQGLLRELAPQVLGIVCRRYGDFEAAEDAVQEALLAAATQWPLQGVPENPRAWLIHVAGNRMKDHLRGEIARRKRETKLVTEVPDDEQYFPAPDEREAETDDTLVLLFMCAHESLTRTSAIALTLRAVGGLTTAEIAHAFLVPEATMAQRISRAKQLIKKSGVGFRMPTDAERDSRLEAVLHVL
jgi:RNA polymerase sigma factor (sigma-70 family)